VKTARAPLPITRMDLTFQHDMPGFRGARHFAVEPLVEGEDAIFARLRCTDAIHLHSGETLNDLTLLVMSPEFVWPNYDIKISDAMIEQLGLSNLEDMAFLAIVHPQDPLSNSTANLYSPIVVNRQTGVADQFVPGTSEQEFGWPLRAPFPIDRED
jgi:flagellar assembly factor FliW